MFNGLKERLAHDRAVKDQIIADKLRAEEALRISFRNVDYTSQLLKQKELERARLESFQQLQTKIDQEFKPLFEMVNDTYCKEKDNIFLVGNIEEDRAGINLIWDVTQHQSEIWLGSYTVWQSQKELCLVLHLNGQINLFGGRVNRAGFDTTLSNRWQKPLEDKIYKVVTTPKLCTFTSKPEERFYNPDNSVNFFDR